ncbi:RagB/SusD family nutrient uptake outer membrane protein [Reichenbachiella sp. MALMAid0571]|uniref:RagB/SusD family nutrient uptake outer membrane protein n=1 Tax=Reichenbachiella sp. MALMAid0571 TaxID=3143939 RepID=UPI0032DF2958
MNIFNKISGIVFIITMISACSDPLDKENLEAVTGDDVWGNPAVAEAYVNDLYGDFMPSNFNAGRQTDETLDVINQNGLSGFLQGTITENSYNDFPYTSIRKINIFLEGIDAATFSAEIKDQLKGQALFWRAWAYFRMVKAYGGVQLVLTPGSSTDIDAAFVSRSKTSECIDQIILDLDNAISFLEDKSSIGRIDKCVALSFKGKVLLYWASPQFNRTNDVSRWTDAYNANIAALEFLDGQDKGLLEDYGELWHNEMNKEVIMVKRFQYPGYANGYSQAAMRPLAYARGAVGANMPSLELVNAYPMKDGSKWDPVTMDYSVLHENRDDRFYASIAYNGAEPFISPMFGNENMWTYWYDKDGDPGTGINGKESRADNEPQFGDWAENLIPHGSFYPAKMLDRDITRTTVEDGQVDWIELRYAEVLMNMAEAANESGKTPEALDALYQIRARAGIEVGSGNYGITASTVADVRQVIMDERFVEFAFEQKRFDDLRRWRIFTSTFNNLNNKALHGLRIEYTGAGARPEGLTDINTISDQFTVTVIEGVQPTSVVEEDKYSFFGIPTSILERNSKIEQNNTWGGTFDPLL